MGKGTRDCDRPQITMKASGVKINTEHLNEINTTLELKRPDHDWWTKDEEVVFRKIKEGWIVDSISDPIHKAFREYGITSSIKGEHTYFPSLKAARQAVNDVSLEAGLNIDTRLTRGKFLFYKIGILPLSIRKNHDWWRVGLHSLTLSQSLKKHFNSVETFRVAWESTDIALTHYPTRRAAHQAVINWLSQTTNALKEK